MDAPRNCSPPAGAANSLPPQAGGVPFDEVLITQELLRRPTRPPDFEAESRAVSGLAQALADSSGEVLKKLAEVAMEVCRAGSAGVSLLKSENGKEKFYWPAIVGAWSGNVGGSMPRESSPCGVVLDRNAVQLFARPEDHYLYDVPIEYPIVEALLTPFHVKGEAIGTVWVISHDESRRFDAEDMRLITSLSNLASAAYQVWSMADAREHHARAEAELAVMTRLHDMAARLLVERDLPSALDEILSAAIKLMDSQMGNVQLLTPNREALHIVAHRGFNDDFLNHFRRVELDDDSACGRALRHRTQVIIEDVDTDPAYACHRAIAASAGYRAVQSTPLLSTDGNVIGMLSTHFKAPHRPSERSLRLLGLYAQHAADYIQCVRSEEALKIADRRKDEFLAILAHELRNPLAPIRTGVQVLQLNGIHPSAASEILPMMDRQVVHLVRLVDDLLDISRITSGRIELKRERCELDTILRNAVESSRSFIDESGAELVLRFPPSRVELDADPTRLSQVFSNLLTNAAKFTDRGGRISLSANQHDGLVEVSVCDNGIGIPPDLLSQVFQMFTQVGRGERNQSGLGIGLYLVQALVELHGGSVAARSGGPGQGAEFVVRLPALSRAERQSEHGGRCSMKTSASCSVLVVDDNLDAANSLSMMLRVLGHTVTTAHDGLEALERAEEVRPDLVLLDLGMPRLDGCGAARRLRAMPWGKEMALVAVTGWGHDDDRRRTREAGFDGHFVKPLDLGTLTELISSITAKASLS